MLKEQVIKILDNYLKIYPNEEKRQERFINYLKNHNSKEIRDWNNFDGHIVVGSFIYAKKENKFLFLYHKDLKMYLYPGGHIDREDKTILDAALREATEETGLDNFKVLHNTKNELIPLDIDTQFIEYNERLALPSHYHYDFRYVLMIDEIQDIKIDTSELRDYKWLDYEEVINMKRYSYIKDKLINIIKDNL